jgi:hypothetical protein
MRLCPSSICCHRMTPCPKAEKAAKKSLELDDSLAERTALAGPSSLPRELEGSGVRLAASHRPQPQPCRRLGNEQGVRTHCTRIAVFFRSQLWTSILWIATRRTRGNSLLDLEGINRSARSLFLSCASDRLTSSGSMQSRHANQVERENLVALWNKP